MSYDLFTDGAGVPLWTVSRLPAYPVFDLVWYQPVSRNTGAETFAAAPYRQEILLTLSWAGMSLADKISFEAFFLGGATGMANGFNYTNSATGSLNIPVRFASSSLPQISEVAFGRYKVQFQLRVTTNYPQYTVGEGTPYASGNRFSIGSTTCQFPVVSRQSTGYAPSIPQTYELNTDGYPVIYRKSTRTIVRHDLSLVLTLFQFAELRTFFISWVHGQQKKFTWIDWAGVSHTVRLGASKITVQQLAYNRYSTEIPLQEEL
jgi:hypothetical protein